MPVLTINPKGLVGNLQRDELDFKITAKQTLVGSAENTFFPNEICGRLDEVTKIELPVTPQGSKLFFKWKGTVFPFSMPNKDVTLSELIRGTNG